MSRIVGIVLIVLALFIAAGLILPAIYRARADEEMRRCQNNLRQIGSLGLSHSTMPGEPVPPKALDYFPAGTIYQADLKPEQRLSWYALILGALDRGDVEPGAKRKKPLQFEELMKAIDVTKPWDAEINQPLGRTRLTQAICPSQYTQLGPDQYSLTNYIGNGGIGLSTPALSLDEAGPKAGVFRYDTRTPLEVIRDGDGLSNTIAVLETTRDIGPWIRGGPTTVRGLDVGAPPFLGKGAAYSGCHRDKGNFGFADGSVRVLTDNIDPAVFQALLTIRGGEKEVDFDDKSMAS
jgi:prepilin-type processing-associated H-X9-DG protein